MTLDRSTSQLHASMAHLASGLRGLARDHADDQDVFHVGGALAARCDDLLDELEARARARGTVLVDRDRLPGISAPALPETAPLSDPGPGEALLDDLREVGVRAHAAQLDWTILHQGALATRDRDLAEFTEGGTEESGRVVRWLTTRIKEGAPQVLATR